MKELTLDLLKSMNPCLWYTANNYERAKEIFGNRSHFNAREIANLTSIPNSHKIWVLLRMLPSDSDLMDFFLQATRMSIVEYNNSFKFQKTKTIDTNKCIGEIAYHLKNKEINELEKFINENSVVYQHCFIGVIFNYILKFANASFKEDRLYYTELMCNIILVEQTAELLDYLCEKIDR